MASKSGVFPPPNPLSELMPDLDEWELIYFHAGVGAAMLLGPQDTIQDQASGLEYEPSTNVPISARGR